MRKRTPDRLTNAAVSGQVAPILSKERAMESRAGAEVNTSLSDYDEPFVMTVTNNVGGTIQGDNGSGINLDGSMPRRL